MTKAIKLLPTGLVCLYFAFMLILTLAFPAYLSVYSVFDDAYYYLGVARNISLGNGSMFAAPLETNGYQPLWLAILAVASFVVGGDRTGLIVACLLLSFAAVIAFLLLARRFHGEMWPAAIVVLTFPLVFLLGMETVLILPLALLYFRASGWMRGVLASLIFFSRLDTIGLILGRITYDLLRYRKIDWRELVVLGLSAAAYVTMNLIIFGTPVPISGMAKSVGAQVFSNVLVLKQFAFAATVPVLTALVLAFSAVKARRFKYEAEMFSGLCALACSISYYYVFSGYPVWGWYYWPVAMMLYWSLLTIKLKSPSTSYRIGSALAIVAISMGLTENVTFTVVSVRSSIMQDAPEELWGVGNVILAEKILAANITPSTFAMGDRAGSFGYYLDDRHRLIQTEGLVADVHYLNAMRADKGLEFLEAHGVDYYIVNRERLWMWDEGYVITDPIMPLSARSGIMLMCFPRSALADELDAGRRGLHIFRFRERVECSEDVLRTFEARKKIYAGIHYNKPVD